MQGALSVAGLLRKRISPAWETRRGFIFSTQKLDTFINKKFHLCGEYLEIACQMSVFYDFLIVQNRKPIVN
ncbi:TPA: hypothetical protein I7753_10915 [Vibrio vulnificus]|uniref:Uncharacterized protein n=2 Tax=Vibrio vulnificus TaxID=672 RepID=A0A3Q0KZ29_VIBVU|nr:Hypothetical protein VV2_0845 [Vibrio vulnificus CMCP6]AMG10412.1 hypothetical protein AL549_03480 [Vibrio vulnificus]KHF87287.1 hypothetical protein OA15_08645 [Vibrio vulnificus]KHF96246.1 hypothetical protein OA14_05175 [Vibrio vulnificus]PNM78199.1 hypothetical protein AL548_006425 [Vibrio vulnificus]